MKNFVPVQTVSKLRRIDKEMLKLKAIPDLYEFTLVNCFIAGGAVRDCLRGVEPKDYDLFFYSDAQKDEFIRKFGRHCQVTGFGNYNWNTFQFITLETGSPQKVTGNFDWDVNQVWMEFSEGIAEGRTYANEYLHLNTKVKTPLSAIMRIPHLLSKGFKIEQKELLFAYTFVAMSVNLANPESVQAQGACVSGGGEQVSTEGVTERAVKAAMENSPLSRALA